MTIIYNDPCLNKPMTVHTRYMLHNPPNWGAVLTIRKVKCHDNDIASQVVIHSVSKAAAELLCGILSTDGSKMILATFGHN